MRRLAAFFVLVLASSSLACGSDDVTNPTIESVTGAWNLATVNGTGLPFLIRTTNPKLELLDDRIVVASDGTFADSFSIKSTDLAGAATTTGSTDTGTWTLNGTSLVLRYDIDASTATATINGGTFIIAAGGFSQVYAKE